MKTFIFSSFVLLACSGQASTLALAPEYKINCTEMKSIPPTPGQSSVLYGSLFTAQRSAEIHFVISKDGHIVEDEVMNLQFSFGDFINSAQLGTVSLQGPTIDAEDHRKINPFHFWFNEASSNDPLRQDLREYAYFIDSKGRGYFTHSCILTQVPGTLHMRPTDFDEKTGTHPLYDKPYDSLNCHN
jgi:hypothetical protein